MDMTVFNDTKHLILDRRKFLGIASGLIFSGFLPKNVMALAGSYTFKQAHMFMCRRLEQ